MIWLIHNTGTKMTIPDDIGFIAYFISCISLAVAIYACYRVSELCDEIKKNKPKSINRKQPTTQRPKGFWD